MATVKSCRGMISRPQGRQPGVLLAQDVQRRKGIWEEVTTVSTVCSLLQLAERRPPHSPEPLAFRAVGALYGGSSSKSSSAVQIPLGSHRLLYKMGRGSAAPQGHRTTSGEIPLAKCHLSLRASSYHHLPKLNQLCKQTCDQLLL